MIAAMGAFLETTERNGKKLSAKRKLYLKFADAKLYLDDGSGTEPFFSNTEEKSEDFVWKHLERMFLVNLAMSKIVAVL